MRSTRNRGKGRWCGESRDRGRVALAVLFATLTIGGRAFAGDAWQELKGKHFIVYYSDSANRSTAERLLNEAERYYRKIGTQLGFTRYSDFWTWDNRAKVVLFPDQQTFRESTNQPQWSTGYADRDSQLFQSRIIVTYKQEQAFFDGLLPHEISHLILHDFIPNTRNIPIWLDEGIAQLEEVNKRGMARKIVAGLVVRGKYISFNSLGAIDVRREMDGNNATIFYAQSLSIVEFLIAKYGSEPFGRLCRELRDGKSFDEALFSAYSRRFRSLADVEPEWLKYIENSSK